MYQSLGMPNTRHIRVSGMLLKLCRVSPDITMIDPTS